MPRRASGAASKPAATEAACMEVGVMERSNTNGRMWLAGALGLMLAAGSAVAQTLPYEQDFEGTAPFDWFVNGNEMTFEPGNPGHYMGVPLLDFWGITLSSESANVPMVGNLSTSGGLRISVDIRVFALFNFFQEPISPGEFPLVFQLSDNTGGPVPASVYFTGPGMPEVADGWVRYTFELPNPTLTTLPPGWGGTGDEDPDTFEPILPPGRTYANVLAHVEDVRLTTFRPGWFYIANFWQVGFDNIRIESLTPQCVADVDDGSSTGTPDGGVGVEDLLYYLSLYDAGSPDADVDNGTGTGTSDGGVGIEDLLYYLLRYDAGC
jgi:hypothetical protein